MSTDKKKKVTVKKKKSINPVSKAKLKEKNKERKYQIWLTYDSNKKRMKFPVMPEKVSISYPDENGKEEVCGIGSITIKEKRGQFQIKFSSSFPETEYQGSIKNIKRPRDYVDFLKKCMKLDGPCRMIITGSPMRMNKLVTISFEIEERGGDIGTIYYSLTATEWRETKIRKLDIQNKNGKKKTKNKVGTVRAVTKEQQKTYTVQNGDYLMKIAKNVLGDSSRWRELYEKNKSVIGPNPNIIQVGMVLTIP